MVRFLKKKNLTLSIIFTTCHWSMEGNVFSHVCLSLILSVNRGPCTGLWTPLCTEPWLRPFLCRGEGYASVKDPAPLCTGACPRKTLVHYKAWTVGKWVVGIRLKCLLA